MTEKICFILNNELINVEINPATVLLDFIRKNKSLTGTKEGCKEGDCGACTVLVGTLVGSEVRYKSINSCLVPLGNLQHKHIVTIEGLNLVNLSPLQELFLDEGASQCGFCTPGFIVSITGALLNLENLSKDELINSIAGNICRCTGYTSIIKVLDKIIIDLERKNNQTRNRLDQLIKNGLLPEYFLSISERLNKIKTEFTLSEVEEQEIYVAGGTDLFVQKPDELINKKVNFLINKNLAWIKQEGSKCVIGGGTTFEELKNSELLNDHFPSIKKHFDLIASLPIRNAATVSGNIINASPIGDVTIWLLALNSSIVLCEGKKKRNILLKDIYLGYKKLDKLENEFLEQIEFELPENNSFFNFEKVSKRTYLDIATVNSALYLGLDKNNLIKIAHLSAGGVAPIPLYLTKTSEYLIGKDISTETIDEAIKIMQSEISPISDIRGSAEYKKVLLSQLFKLHFVELFPKLIPVESVI